MGLFLKVGIISIVAVSVQSIPLDRAPTGVNQTVSISNSTEAPAGDNQSVSISNSTGAPAGVSQSVSISNSTGATAGDNQTVYISNSTGAPTSDNQSVSFSNSTGAPADDTQSVSISNSTGTPAGVSQSVSISNSTGATAGDNQTAFISDSTNSSNWFRKFNYNEISEHSDDYSPLFMTEKMVHFTVKCLLDKVPCANFQPHREWFPFIMRSQCGFCHPIQKARFNAITSYVKEKYPNYYNALIDKYSKDY